MSFSLYAATVPSFLQILESVSGLLAKAEDHCASKNLAPQDIIQARLAEDMLPFAFQIRQTVTNSLGAIEGVRRGVVSPDTSPPPETFAELKARVTGALEGLRAIKPEEVDGWLDRDVKFSYGETNIPFKAQDFLLSFSLPNFYFHATTAYDLLRWKGLPIGKRDFLGKLRVKT